jgi:hypothetical protein
MCDFRELELLCIQSSYPKFFNSFARNRFAFLEKFLDFARLSMSLQNSMQKNNTKAQRSTKASGKNSRVKEKASPSRGCGWFSFVHLCALSVSSF